MKKKSTLDWIIEILRLIAAILAGFTGGGGFS